MTAPWTTRVALGAWIHWRRQIPGGWLVVHRDGDGGWQWTRCGEKKGQAGGFASPAAARRAAAAAAGASPADPLVSSCAELTAAVQTLAAALNVSGR